MYLALAYARSSLISLYFFTVYEVGVQLSPVYAKGK